MATPSSLPPFPLQDIRQFPYSFQDWLRRLQSILGGSTGMISWVQIDKTGSNLTDLATRNHNQLQNIQGGTSGNFFHLSSLNLTALTTRNHNDLQNIAGGASNDYSHLTAAQNTSLTGSADTTLHFHSSDRARSNHTGTQTVSTISDITASIYTPTLFNTTNLSSSTAYSCQYIKVGTIVTVSGKVDITATTALSTSTILGISLPVASNIANDNECAGTANDATLVMPGVIIGDATNDRALLQVLATSILSQSMFFTFTYRII